MDSLELLPCFLPGWRNTVRATKKDHERRRTFEPFPFEGSSVS